MTGSAPQMVPDRLPAFVKHLRFPAEHRRRCRRPLEIPCHRHTSSALASSTRANFCRRISRDRNRKQYLYQDSTRLCASPVPAPSIRAETPIVLRADLRDEHAPPRLAWSPIRAGDCASRARIGVAGNSCTASGMKASSSSRPDKAAAQSGVPPFRKRSVSSRRRCSISGYVAGTYVAWLMVAMMVSVHAHARHNQRHANYVRRQ
jgi:hypothetical protein